MLALLHPRAAGAGILLAVALGCRDAPTAPPQASIPALSPALAGDTSSTMPSVPAEVLWGTTEILFYDSRYGGAPHAVITGDMEYIGNRASMDIKYTIAGDGTDHDNVVHDEQNLFYFPLSPRRFTRKVDVATLKNCGLTINAGTTHRAWWWVWFPVVPPYESSRPATQSVAHTLQTDLCPAPEEEPPPDGGSGGGGGSGGWITIETCYYWAYYENGVLVDIELRYCDYSDIPVNQQ